VKHEIKRLNRKMQRILDRINMIVRIDACRPEAGQAISHRLRQLQATSVQRVLEIGLWFLFRQIEDRTSKHQTCKVRKIFRLHG
jgi:hypothetical protein